MATGTLGTPGNAGTVEPDASGTASDRAVVVAVGGQGCLGACCRPVPARDVSRAQEGVEVEGPESGEGTEVPEEGTLTDA